MGIAKNVIIDRCYNTLFNKAGDANLVMFTALSVILLAFFILLNSIAVIDEERKLTALGSLVGSFHILPGGLSVFSDGGTGITPPVAPMLEGEDYLVNIINILEQGIVMEGAVADVGIMNSENEFVITLMDNILFESGRTIIKKKGGKVLKRVCKFLNLSSKPVLIEGHTDNIPINSTRYPSNWELSVERALSALNFMVEKGEVNPKRLSLAGYGDTKPLVLNDTRENRQKNRRINIILSKGF